MSQGYFARHLSRMRTLYTERRKALAAAIESSMKGMQKSASKTGECISSHGFAEALEIPR